MDNKFLKKNIHIKNFLTQMNFALLLEFVIFIYKGDFTFFICKNFSFKLIETFKNVIQFGRKQVIFKIFPKSGINRNGCISKHITKNNLTCPFLPLDL